MSFFIRLRSDGICIRYVVVISLFIFALVFIHVVLLIYFSIFIYFLYHLLTINGVIVIYFLTVGYGCSGSPFEKRIIVKKNRSILLSHQLLNPSDEFIISR